MSNVNEVMDAAKAYARENAYQGAVELHRLLHVGVLGEGVIRTCAKMLEPLNVHGGGFQLAKALFEMAVLDYVVESLD